MDHGATMYSGRSKQMSSDWRNRPFMNPLDEELYNDGYHMADSYDRQADRDWTRRLSRDRDAKPNRFKEDYRYKDDDRYLEGSPFREDDDVENDCRDRYSYDSNKARQQRNDHKRYSDIDKRLYRDDSDRRGHSSRQRDFRDRDLNRSRDHSRDRDAKDSREGGREGREPRSRLNDGVRDRDYSESAKDSRGGGRDSKCSKDGRDSKHQDRVHNWTDKGWDKKESTWNGYDDDNAENAESVEHMIRNTSGESRYGDSYKNQAPNNTIMIRGLAQHITENDIRQDILKCGLMPKDIRLIRKKDTGASRGFAFVEFNTLQEASQWMEMKQGVLMLYDHYRAVMQFSIPKDSQVDRTSMKSSQDWHCIKCGAHNFKRRDACFKCHASRRESEGGEGSAEVSVHPTPTVLLRGLDVLSTEDSVLQAIKSISSVPIRSIRIGQDSLTNTSRGVCYLEMNHVMDAMYMHSALTATPPIVDGKKVLVSYCKIQHDLPGITSGVSSNATTAAAAALAIAGGEMDPVAQYSHLRHTGSADLTQYSLEDVPRLADYCASLYATSPAEYTAYQQYYRQYYHNQISQGSSITLPSQSQADSVNAAAAVAQSAIQQVQAAKEIKKQIEDPQLLKSDDVLKMTHMKAQNPSVQGSQSGSGGQKCNVPDVSTYQYDETSGYYYDPQTGLYYDASSQYYYNPQTQQFLYWDAEKQAYLPAPVCSDDSVSNKEEGKKVKEKDRQDKVKVAKKIAKDMERWAKTLNQKKDNARQNLALDSSILPSSKSVGAADAGYAVLERKERPALDVQTLPFGESEEKQAESPSQQGNNSVGWGGNTSGGGSACGLVAAYGGGSESDEEIEDVVQEDKQHTNWAKLACLLCKRQFPTKESLVRHQQLSDLHKQNLESWYRIRGLDPHDPQQRNKRYRDRAKERRQKFGEPNQPHPNHLKEKYLKTREEVVSISYEEPTKAGIGSDNVGNKLLQKMGWQEGMGLGKSNQGRTSIIQAEHRVSTAGLGAKGGTFGALPGETYKDCVKKMMFARYHELTEQEQEQDS
ncbi:RNA-binding protein 5-like [Periplaneta americana]|uniref:RNA-binding protein 5-like n=1 Tax=Periplaneta americana TaxID=6978 RepID=UPI0037E72530